MLMQTLKATTATTANLNPFASIAEQKQEGLNVGNKVHDGIQEVAGFVRGMEEMSFL